MKTIEINTSFKVVIKFNLATVADRGIAFIIDMAIIWATIGLSTLILSAFYSSPPQNLFLYIAVPIYGFYTPIFEIINNGQTPGKRIMNIQVVRIDGRRTRTSDFLMRWIFRLIDIYSSGSILAILTITSSPKSQRVGDILADTCVIKIKERPETSLENLVKLNNLKTDSTMFPEVVKLIEADVVIIKETVERFNNFPTKGHEKAINHLIEVLEELLSIKCEINKINFLNTIIKDYVILTR